VHCQKKENAMKTKSVAASFVLLAFCIAFTMQGRVGHAQEMEKPGSINTHYALVNQSINQRPVMVSAIRDGKIEEQQETSLPYDRRLASLAPGVYDVRVEGDGVVTEVKRGINVFSDREINLNFLMRAGTGVHVVEFATGGLTREEVAARLQKLEAEVAQLQKSRKPK
jgi:hypothetical protein